MKPVKAVIHRSVSGAIERKNEDKIFVKIYDEDLDYFQHNFKRESCDIFFNVNKQPFQLQHNALKLMREHNLFNCLINNPKYDDDTDDPGLNDHYAHRWFFSPVFWNQIFIDHLVEVSAVNWDRL